MKIKKILSTFILVLSFTVFATNAFAQENNILTKDDIKSFTENKIQEIISHAKKSNDKQEFLEYLSKESPNFVAYKYMAMWILGNNRKKFTSKEQLNEFVSVFTNILVNFYGGVVYDHKNYNIKMNSVESFSPTLYKVVFFVDMGKQSIDIVWQIRVSRDNKIMITDMAVSGVSFLQAKRFEYKSLFQRCNNDPQKLIDALKNQGKQKDKKSC